MSNRLRSFLIVVMSIVVVMAALPMNAFRVNADSENYEITYVANNNTSTTHLDKFPKSSGTTYPLLSNDTDTKFEYEGYIFDGWYSSSGSTGGTKYGASTTIPDDVESFSIYAHWKFDSANYIKVTYNPNGGSGVIHEDVVKKDIDFYLENQAFTAPDGKVLAGWNTADDGSGVSYTITEKVHSTSDLTLYAQWEDKCTVTFHENNGTDNTKTQDVPKNVSTALSSVSSLGFTASASTPTFSFIGWSLGAEDKTIKYTDTEKVTLSANTDLYAQWAETTVITFDANATDATGTMGTQTVGRGYETTLLANGFDRTGYVFKGWSTTPGATTADYTTTINLASNAEATLTLYAVWEKEEYTVAFYDENGTTKLAEISVPYQEAPAYPTANPTKAPDNTTVYTFAGWSLKDDTTNTIVNPLPTVTGNVAYKAVYTSTTRTYTVSISTDPNGIGSVTDVSGDYEYETDITLSYSLSSDDINNGYRFIQWKITTGELVAYNTENNYGYKVVKDVNIVAEFSNQYEVTARPDAPSHGSVDGGNVYTYKDTVTLTANPNTANGYYFVRWEKDSTPVGDNTPVLTFELDANEHEVVAYFDNTYTYATAASPAAGGTVTAGDSTSYGTAVQLTATPNTGYHFVSWSDGTNTWTTPNLSYTVTSNATVTATFSNQYVVTAEPDDSAHGSVSGGNTYTYGDIVTLKATPNTADGYYFVRWEKDGTTVGDSTPELSFTLDASDHNVVAVFNNEYNVSVVSSNTAHGSASGNVTYIYGDTAVVEAAPVTGYHFVNWTDESGTEKSTDATYSFPVSRDIQLKANFAIDRHTVLFVNEDGTVLQSEVLEYGQTPVYTKATPTKPRTQQYSYTFAGWDKEITTVTADKTYTATYSSTINYYTVKYVNDDNTVLQEGQFAYGTNAYYQQKATPTKKPTAQFTYTFAGWDNKVTLVTDDVTYTATYDYTINKYKVTFVNEDGSVLQTGELEYGKMPVYEKDTPTKASTVQETFTFAGWDKEITKVTGETVYTATYTAKTITKDDVNFKHFTVTFESNGGSEVVSQLVAEGGVAFKPEEPLRERYTFGGWYIDAALTKPFSFATVITSDITLYAKWIKGSQDVEVTYAIVGSGSMSWNIGSGEDLEVAVERSKDNDTIATHFKGVQIDGVELDYYLYELSDDNSAVIIRSDAFDGITAGTHTITIVYDDGKAEVELVIADANKPAETVEETEATEAGGDIVNITTEKTSYLGLWIALAVVAGVVICAFPIFIIKRRGIK